MRPVPFIDTALLLLEEYLGREDLARALGVEVTVLTSWRQGTWEPARRQRQFISLLVFVCQELGPYAPEARALGRWLMRANPALGGARPAVLLEDRGTDAYDAVIEASGYGPAVVAARPEPGKASRL